MPVFDPGVPWLRGTATLTNGSTTVETDGVITLNEILEGDRLYVMDGGQRIGPLEIVGGEGDEIELREPFEGATGSYSIAIDRNPITRTGAKTLRDVARILATIEDADIEAIGEIRDEAVQAKEDAQALYGDLSAVQQAKTDAQTAAGNARDDAILTAQLVGQAATYADNADASAQAAAQSKNAAAQSAHDADISAGAAQNAEQNIAALTEDFTGSYVTYVFTASGGETSLSGEDDDGNTLSYSPGTASVFKNGVKLVAGSGYSATDGTSITDLDPLDPGDVIEVQAFNLFSVIDSARRSQNLADLEDREEAIENLGPFDSAEVKKIGMPHVRRLDEILADRISIKDFGAYGGDPFLDTEAFKEAITYANEIWIPPGDYQITETLNIKRMLVLRGATGSLHGASYVSRLFFPGDRPGIILHYHDVNADEYGNHFLESPSTGRSDGTILKNLALRTELGSHPAPNDTAHAFVAHTRFRMQDVNIANFPGNGVHIFATAASSDPERRGNANNFYLDSVQVNGVSGHGVFVDGADVNAGLGVHLDVSSVGMGGIYDSSFLGNTWQACHVAFAGVYSRVHHQGKRYYCRSDTLGGTTEPGTDESVWVYMNDGGPHSQFPDWQPDGYYRQGYAYWTDNSNARCVFVGCYSEGGGTPSHIVAPSLILGGFISTSEGAPSLSVHTNGNLVSNRPVLYIRTANGGSIQSSLGGGVSADSQNIRNFTSSTQSYTWEEVFKGPDYRFAASNYNGHVFYYLRGPDTEATFGRSSPVPISVEISKLFVGENGSARRQVTSQRPSWLESGREYARGDVLFNSQPNPGRNAGWICTTGGIAGSTAVFKEFGAIDA